MSRTDVAALRDAFRAFSRGNFETAGQVLAPMLEVEHGKGVPHNGTWRGAERHAELLSQYYRG
jgi:hypothetical protein